MNLLKLKVVIWKNLIIRRRHWLLTTFESLLPVVVFFLIAYVRSQIKGYNKTIVDHPTYNIEQPINYMYGEFSTLLYVPNTPYYEDLIHRTVVKFQLQSDSEYLLYFILYFSWYFELFFFTIHIQKYACPWLI